MSRQDDGQVIPDIICDSERHTKYKTERYFGKGGFAKCYEIKNLSNNRYFAGKIVSKKLLTKQNQREKMSQEIEIHQSLKHKNVVGFYGFFEDVHNIYIVLELCKNRSMMELHKRRKRITEPETRYYMRQIVSGVQYLHSNRIIHRDLKLGNLFLNSTLIVKIGDFGLAAKLEFEGERKKTLCGTPNYIAPEILNKKGHSFEVDIWSIGCIMYTLLIGKPPFETESLKETYARIKKCDYKISSNISRAAKQMITLMLQAEPKNRPNIMQLQHIEFIQDECCPTSLPITSLAMEPRLDKMEASIRKPLLEINNGHCTNVSPLKPRQDIAATLPLNTRPIEVFEARENFLQLKAMLYKVLKAKPGKNNLKYLDEMTDPQAQPMYWVSKWVDYSDKYGFGYQLSDEGVGVMFNDTTKLILLPNGINVHYVDRNGEEFYMTIDNYAGKYDKKIKLLTYFNRYMKEHLVKTGASVVKEIDSISRTPHLHQWVRSTSGVLMQLNNGTVQMNFGDHTKIIMCPLMAAITYIEEDRSFRTFKFDTIEKNGCTVGLHEKMRYAYEKISMLLDNDNVKA